MFVNIISRNRLSGEIGHGILLQWIENENGPWGSSFSIRSGEVSSKSKSGFILLSLLYFTLISVWWHNQQCLVEMEGNPVSCVTINPASKEPRPTIREILNVTFGLFLNENHIFFINNLFGWTSNMRMPGGLFTPRWYFSYGRKS